MRSDIEHLLYWYNEATRPFIASCLKNVPTPDPIACHDTLVYGHVAVFMNLS